MMKFEVARARDWFREGLPLAGKVDKHLAIDIELFSRGGIAVLERHRAPELRCTDATPGDLQADETVAPGPRG